MQVGGKRPWTSSSAKYVGRHRKRAQIQLKAVRDPKKIAKKSKKIITTTAIAGRCNYRFYSFISTLSRAWYCLLCSSIFSQRGLRDLHKLHLGLWVARSNHHRGVKQVVWANQADFLLDNTKFLISFYTKLKKSGSFPPFWRASTTPHWVCLALVAMLRRWINDVNGCEAIVCKVFY